MGHVAVLEAVGGVPSLSSHGQALGSVCAHCFGKSEQFLSKSMT